MEFYYYPAYVYDVIWYRLLYSTKFLDFAELRFTVL
jgi:hypothetical protein